MAERGNLADLVEILGFGLGGKGADATPPPVRMAMTFLMARSAPAGRRPRRREQAPNFPAYCTAASDNRAPIQAKSIPLSSPKFR